MENAVLAPKAALRRSGTLSLFLAPDNGTELSNAYSRFKVCRGFIDDLNRILPIRLRIQLEGEISRGALTGRFQAGQTGYRWEFLSA